MKDFLHWLSGNWYYLAMFLFAMWEYWVGKTDKLKSNSTVELITSAVGDFLKKKDPKLLNGGGK